MHRPEKYQQKKEEKKETGRLHEAISRELTAKPTLNHMYGSAKVSRLKPSRRKASRAKHPIHAAVVFSVSGSFRKRKLPSRL